MTAVMISLMVVMYLSGCVLMRAFLKISDADDQDSLKPVLLWPWFPLSAVFELLWLKKFKW